MRGTEDGMRVEEVESVLRRQPFVPLRLHKVAGGWVDLPFHHVAVVLRSQGLLVFKGVKHERSRQAKSYEVIPFDQIDRIEPRASTRRRRSA